MAKRYGEWVSQEKWSATQGCSISILTFRRVYPHAAWYGFVIGCPVVPQCLLIISDRRTKEGEFVISNELFWGDSKVLWGCSHLTIGIPKISHQISLKHPGHPGIPSNFSIVFPQELRIPFSEKAWIVRRPWRLVDASVPKLPYTGGEICWNRPAECTLKSYKRLCQIRSKQQILAI